MEDAHACLLDLKAHVEGANATDADRRLAYFGVYDGHGGDKVAIYTGEHLHEIVTKQEAYKSGDLKKALQDGFLAADRAILSGMQPAIRPGEPTPGADSLHRSQVRGGGFRLHGHGRRCVKRQDLLRMCRRTRPHCTSSHEQANAGDSRTVLGVKGRAKPLSFDHKPQNEGTSVARTALPR